MEQRQIYYFISFHERNKMKEYVCLFEPFLKAPSLSGRGTRVGTDLMEVRVS